MVDDGVTVITLPDNPPGFQVYVPAPVAVKDTLAPAQIEAADAATLTDGAGETETNATACAVQLPRLPVTVNEPESVGVATTVAPVRPPGIHVYVVAPFDASVTD